MPRASVMIHHAADRGVINGKRIVKGVGVADQTMQMSVVVSRESRPAKT